MSENENTKDGVPNEKGENETVDDQSRKADEGETAASLPVDVEKVFGQNTYCLPPEDKQEEKQRRFGAAAKILSVFISVIFCGTALLCIASNAVQSARGLTKEDAGAYLIKEVFGDGAKVKSEEVLTPESEDPAADTSPADTENGDAKSGGEPQDSAVYDEPESPTEYPIIYESLANTELLTSLSNETSYEPDLEKLYINGANDAENAKAYKQYGNGEPLVLIVHTHGTEAYTEEGVSGYTENTPFRTEDVTKNVVAVGDVMTKVFEMCGVGVIHCEEMFDKESYRDSYSRSFAAIKKYLKEYPSISYVFDVHRDSVIRADMTNVATYAEYSGVKTAQVMSVVGTDEGGADHKGWETNLSLALLIQKEMIDVCPTLPRRINLRSAAFNQALCPGSLLLEIGSCANTLDEAKRAAVLCASSIAAVIKGGECGVSADEMIEATIGSDR